MSRRTFDTRREALDFAADIRDFGAPESIEGEPAVSTPPPPTKTGIFRRYRECHCKVVRSRNPHLWVRAYCPPQPMPPFRAEVSS